MNSRTVDFGLCGLIVEPHVNTINNLTLILTLFFHTLARCAYTKTFIINQTNKFLVQWICYIKNDVGKLKFFSKYFFIISVF